LIAVVEITGTDFCGVDSILKLFYEGLWVLSYI